jgi:hypothetical protein
MNKSPVVEGLIDEFYDDVDAGRNWLDQQGVFTPGLSHDELCDLFVRHSLQVML